MDERLRLLLKKTRRFQIAGVAVAVVCLLVFLVFNFTLNEHSGAFEHHNHVDSEVTVPLDRKGLENLEIEASDVKLEVGMVSNLSEPVVRLVGKGYTNQVAKVDLKGSRCSIELRGKQTDENTLTMQVLLPQCDLNSVKINGENLNLHVERLRSSYLQANLNGGYGYIADVKAHGMEIMANEMPLRFANNRATSVKVGSQFGSVTFMENTFKQVETVNDEGGIFVYDNRVKGNWQLANDNGDITMLSKNLPYNLLINAKAEGDGKVDLGYVKRFWKDADVVRMNAGQYYGSVGNNPNNMIECATVDGDINIGKRERYSNLDPYAGDYPYADQNPYVVERSTKTK